MSDRFRDEDIDRVEEVVSVVEGYSTEEVAGLLSSLGVSNEVIFGIARVRFKGYDEMEFLARGMVNDLEVRIVYACLYAEIRGNVGDEYGKVTLNVASLVSLMEVVFRYIENAYMLGRLFRRDRYCRYLEGLYGQGID